MTRKRHGDWETARHGEPAIVREPIRSSSPSLHISPSPRLPSSFRLHPLVAMRRPERVADILREEISQIVGYELEDPRLTMVTVTDVRLSDNLKAARVYVTVVGTEEEHRLALAALRRAAPYVRKQLGLSLNLPRTPEILFVRDRVEESGERVDKLLEKIEKDWEREERMKDDG